MGLRHEPGAESLKTCWGERLSASSGVMACLAVRGDQSQIPFFLSFPELGHWMAGWRGGKGWGPRFNRDLSLTDALDVDAGSRVCHLTSRLEARERDYLARKASGRVLASRLAAVSGCAMPARGRLVGRACGCGVRYHAGQTRVPVRCPSAFTRPRHGHRGRTPRHRQQDRGGGESPVANHLEVVSNGPIRYPDASATHGTRLTYGLDYRISNLLPAPSDQRLQ